MSNKFDQYRIKVKLGLIATLPLLRDILLNYFISQSSQLSKKIDREPRASRTEQRLNFYSKPEKNL